MHKILTVSALLILTACARMPAYPQPGPGESAAIFEGTRKVSLYTVDDQQCVTGYAYAADKEIRLTPGKEVIVAYGEKIGSNHFCSIDMAFTPEKDERYTLRTALRMSEEDKGRLLPNFNNATCQAQLVRKTPDGTETPVAIRQIPPGMFSATCIHK